MIHFAVSLPLSTRHRVSQLLFHPTKAFMAVQSHDRTVDIFRVRTEDEIRKKQARRKRREREKARTKAEKGKEKGTMEVQDGMDVDAEQQQVALVDLFTPFLVVRATGKIRSFSFSDDPAHDALAGFNVSLCIIPSFSLSNRFERSCLHCPSILWKYTTSLHPQKVKTNPQKPYAFFPSTSQDTEPMSARYV